MLFCSFAFMNLLMITRKIDKDDWLAGHSYEWARKISEKLIVDSGQFQPKADPPLAEKVKSSKLYVLCLSKGNVDGLDAEVFSLGKERGNSRWQRFWKFQRLAKKLVPIVDGIFVHQNPEYAIAVWPWAFFYRKKIVSWYTHKSVTWKSRLMLAMSKKVLTASKKSFRIKSDKVEIVGHGIDVEKFNRSRIVNNVAEGFSLPRKADKSARYEDGGLKTSATSERFRIITVGRIAPTKDLETLILAVKELVASGHENIELKIYGDAALELDKSYLGSLKNIVRKSNLENYVKFNKSVPHSKIQEIYQSADLFVNLSQTGSLDKAVLEAMSCEIPVITSNEGFYEMLKPFEDLTLTKPNDPAMLTDKILGIKRLNQSDKNALGANLRSIIMLSHNLDNLADKIFSSFN